MKMHNHLSRDQNMPEMMSLKICRRMKQWLFLVSRFPSFTPDYLLKHIPKAGTANEQDVEQYQSNCSTRYRVRLAILVSIYLAYCFKNTVYPYKTLGLLDYSDPSANVHLQDMPSSENEKGAPKELVYTFACLATNCSRFKPVSVHGDPKEATTLGEDASKLPLFMMCNPFLDLFYTPVTKLDAFGIFAFSASSFNVLILGAWPPLQQLIFPAHNLMVMYIVAPELTRQIMRSRVRQLILDLAISLHNFRLDCMYRYSNSIIKSVMESPDPHKGEKEEQQQEQQPRNRLGPQTRHHLQIRESLQGILASSRTQTPRYSCIHDHHLALATSSIHGHKSRSALLQNSRAERISSSKLVARIGGETLDDSDALVDSIVKKSSLRGKTRVKLEEMVDECMPATRSDWWRPQIARQICFTLALSLGAIGLIATLAFAYIQNRVNLKKSLLAEYARHMRQSKCALWYIERRLMSVGGRGGGKSIIQLDELDLGWSWFAMLETALLNVLPGMCMAVMFTYYYALICEMALWLAELRLYLVASLVSARFKLTPPSRIVASRSASPLVDDNSRWSQQRSVLLVMDREQLAANGMMMMMMMMKRKKSSSEQIVEESAFSMRALQVKFKRETQFRFLVLLTRLSANDDDGGDDDEKLAHPEKIIATEDNSSLSFINSKSNDRHRLEFFLRESERELLRASRRGLASDRAGQGMVLDEYVANVEALEQVYVNLRLFVEEVRSYTPSIAVLLTLSYLLNYGLVLLAVLYSRNIANFTNEPLFMIVFGWSIANFLIFFAANFHENAKKLQPLLWSMIAQLAYSEDMRVKHLRSLYVKQVQILDGEGGLALTAFGIRVTYVNSIQLFIWTATIFAIALKQR